MKNHFDFKDLMTFGLFLLAALWKAIHNNAKMTNSSVSISSVFIPTSFPFPERTIPTCSNLTKRIIARYVE